jgi:hypothetical protein
MALSRGQKIALGSIAGAALLVGGYLWWKQKQAAKIATPALPSPSPVATPTTTPVSGVTPLTDVLGFQKWYNVQGFKPALVEDGINGSMTGAAYTKYATQYLKK